MFICWDNSNIFIRAKETAVDREGEGGGFSRLRVHDRLLGQGYLPCWMRRALMGYDGTALESRRAVVLAAQNGERDGRSGDRV